MFSDFQKLSGIRKRFEGFQGRLGFRDFSEHLKEFRERLRGCHEGLKYDLRGYKGIQVFFDKAVRYVTRSQLNSHLVRV